MSTDGPLQVRQVVTDDHYGTRLVPLPRDVLPRLARLLAQAGRMEDFRTLGYSETPAMRGFLTDEIAGDLVVRTGWDDAAAIDLTPTQAGLLANALTDTTFEPAECDATRCAKFADPDGRHCTEHAAQLADPWMTGVA